ncbi:hypothetical protein [Luedemannella helvata]|uniref:Exo-alpha-sialidase n=1 Tax=Luedemannella helvata TaxID=349315 RepID=A0ABP4VW70_9ACTN
MPDDLDRLLRSTRADLLDDIDGPDLDRVTARADTLRRRRRAIAASTAAAGATLALTLWGFLGAAGTQALPTPAGPSGGPPVTVRPTTTAMPPDRDEWNGDDLRFAGAVSTDLPGEPVDVEFVDPNVGYAVLAQCGADAKSSCQYTMQYTENGGRTWEARSLPATQATTGHDILLNIVPLGGSSLVVTGFGTWFSPDAGRTWQPSQRPLDPPEVRSIPDGGKLVLDADMSGGPDCPGSRVDAFFPNGTRAQLANQPPIGVCWVANAEAVGGVWWVGGRSSKGRPAVAASRDAGVTWATVEFPTVETAPEAWPKVTFVGSRTYVTVVSGKANVGSIHGATQIMAIHRSTDGGHTFAPFAGYGLPALTGDAVPLLDGRIVVASAGLSMSFPSGTRFVAAPDDVPYVRAIRRTDVGWIAYDLDRSGTVARSMDGILWQRLTIR